MKVETILCLKEECKKFGIDISKWNTVYNEKTMSSHLEGEMLGFKWYLNTNGVFTYLRRLNKFGEQVEGVNWDSKTLEVKAYHVDENEMSVWKIFIFDK